MHKRATKRGKTDGLYSASNARQKPLTALSCRNPQRKETRPPQKSPHTIPDPSKNKDADVLDKNRWTATARPFNRRTGSLHWLAPERCQAALQQAQSASMMSGRTTINQTHAGFTRGGRACRARLVSPARSVGLKKRFLCPLHPPMPPPFSQRSFSLCSARFLLVFSGGAPSWQAVTCCKFPATLGATVLGIRLQTPH